MIIRTLLCIAMFCIHQRSRWIFPALFMDADATRNHSRIALVKAHRIFNLHTQAQ
jgi:hypothetical protein